MLSFDLAPDQTCVGVLAYQEHVSCDQASNSATGQSKILLVRLIQSLQGSFLFASDD